MTQAHGWMRRTAGRAWKAGAILAAVLFLAAQVLAGPSPIVQRNLFSPERKPPAPPTPAAVPKLDLSGLQQIKLKGVLALGGVKKAILEGPNKVLGTESATEPGRLTVSEGASVAGFKVDVITGEGVTFKHEGLTHTLELHPGKKKDTKALAKAAPVAPRGRSRAAMVLPWQQAAAGGPLGGAKAEDAAQAAKDAAGQSRAATLAESAEPDKPTMAPPGAVEGMSDEDIGAHLASLQVGGGTSGYSSATSSDQQAVVAALSSSPTLTTAAIQETQKTEEKTDKKGDDTDTGDGCDNIWDCPPNMKPFPEIPEPQPEGGKRIM